MLHPLSQANCIAGGSKGSSPMPAEVLGNLPGLPPLLPTHLPLFPGSRYLGTHGNYSIWLGSPLGLAMPLLVDWSSALPPNCQISHYRLQSEKQLPGGAYSHLSPKWILDIILTEINGFSYAPRSKRQGWLKPTFYFQGTYNRLLQTRCPQRNGANVIMSLILGVLEEGNT